MNRNFLAWAIATIFILYFMVMTSQAMGKEIDHELFSSVLNESRHFTVVLPESYNEKLGVSYPVLYVLDGVQQLPHTSGTAKSLYTYGEAPDLIIVGIDSINRTRDMTPKMLPDVEDSGKADSFLKFLNSELKPYISQRYRTNGYNMLAGHSFGGLLVTYSLIINPNAFQARFAFSPSLRFLGSELFEQLQVIVSKKLERNTYFYMNVGGEQERVLEAFLKVKTILNNASPKLYWNAIELPQETHFTTPIIGQFQAFRELFKNWKLSLSVSSQGVTAIEEFYQSLSSRAGYNIAPEEAQVNNAAYEVLNVTGDSDLAKQIFELNSRNYPESPNSYAGLARISIINKDLTTAAKLMEKAISLLNKEDSRKKVFEERLRNIKESIKNDN